MNEKINAEKKANIGNVNIRSISVNKQAHIEKFCPEPTFNGDWFCPFCGERLSDSYTGHLHEIAPPTVSGTVELYEELSKNRYREISFVLDDMEIIFEYFVVTGNSDVKDGYRIVSSDNSDAKTVFVQFSSGGYHATLEEEL